MAYMLPHLTSGYAVDQAIVDQNNADKLIIVRFGHDWDKTCMKQVTTSLI